MAHQTHAIPWNVLASNLKLRKVCKCQRDCTNLHPRFKPTQGKEITYFVEAFVRNIESHAQTERAKFPAFDPPSEDDILIDEALARKISPTIHLSCIDFGYGDDFPEEGFKCPGVVRRGTGPASVFASPGWDGKCRCLLPESERKAGAFLRRYQSNDCYRFFDVNKSAFFNLEVVKALLLYGEMEPVLRVCAHEFNDLASWWSVAQCYCSVSKAKSPFAFSHPAIFFKWSGRANIPHRAPTPDSSSSSRWRCWPTSPSTWPTASPRPGTRPLARQKRPTTAGQRATSTCSETAPWAA